MQLGDYFLLAYLSVAAGMAITAIVCYVLLLRRSRVQLKARLSALTMQQSAARSCRLAQQQALLGSAISQRFFSRSFEYGRTIPADADWQALDEAVNDCFPQFKSALLACGNLSETEYRVTLLVKLGMTNARMADLLCKSKEAVTSVRRRLCAKHLPAAPPSPKAWDDYVKAL